MRKITEINGIKVHYEQESPAGGFQKTLVFLNGWEGSSSSWPENIKELAKKYNCIAIDFPGFGVSETPEEVWGVYEYARFVQDFVDTMRLENVVLVGKSFGGRVSIAYAATCSEASSCPLDRLILVAAAGIESRGFLVHVKILFFKTGKFVMGKLGKDMNNPFVQSLCRAFKLSIEKNTYRKQVKDMVLGQNLAKVARKTMCPTLIIWGADDEILPLKVGQKLHKLIGPSIFKIVGSAGHNLNETHFAQFNTLVEDFVAD